MTAITNDNYENELQKLYDTDENTVSYNYFSLPNPMLDKAIVSNKQFLKDMRSYAAEECKKYSMSMEYYNWLRDAYKNLKTKTKNCNVFG